MPTHSRKPSGGGSQHHTARRNSHSQPSPPKHLRTQTAPEAPTLLRLPSTSSTVASASSRSRRATLTNPSTPTASSATSYFSPQSTSAGQDPQRRPPASHSGHGIDNSRGPPITLVTRGNSDIARRNTTNTTDFAYAQQRSLPSGLVSPGGLYQSSRREEEEESVTSSRAPQTAQQTTLPRPSRRNSTSASRPPARRMASSTDDSSDYSAGPRSRMEDYRAAHSGAPNTPGTDGEKEDLFMHIAADAAPKPRPLDTAARVDRLKVRPSHVCWRMHRTEAGPRGLAMRWHRQMKNSLLHSSAFSRLLGSYYVQSYAPACIWAETMPLCICDAELTMAVACCPSKQPAVASDTVPPLALASTTIELYYANEPNVRRRAQVQRPTAIIAPAHPV